MPYFNILLFSLVTYMACKKDPQVENEEQKTQELPGLAPSILKQIRFA